MSTPTVELDLIEFSGAKRKVPHHETLSRKSVVLAEPGTLYTAGGIPLIHTCPLRDEPRSRIAAHQAFQATLDLNKIQEGKIARSGSQRYFQDGYLIGLLPKNVTMKRMGIRPSATELEHPEFAGAVIRCMDVIWEQVREDCPEIYEDMESAPRVDDEWTLGDTPFTTAQVNLTAALPYHMDRGNLPWSPCSMLIMSTRSEGGWLHVPQLNLLVEGKDGTVVTFYQDSLWHGVTPISVSSRLGSARISIVGYVNRSVHKELTEAGGADLNRRAMRQGTEVGQIIREGAVPESMRRALMGTPVRFEGDPG